MQLIVVSKYYFPNFFLIVFFFFLLLFFFPCFFECLKAITILAGMEYNGDCLNTTSGKVWSLFGNFSGSGSIRGLPINGALSISLDNYGNTTNGIISTYPTLSILFVTFFDFLTAVLISNINTSLTASFVSSNDPTAKTGIQNLNVLFAYNDPNNVFYLNSAMDYTATCIVGVQVCA